MVWSTFRSTFWATGTTTTAASLQFLATKSNTLGTKSYSQITAIENLEKSFKDNRPRALIQMATGSGKTYTAIISVYRLLKYPDAKRILFLVDTKNLGEQTVTAESLQAQVVESFENLLLFNGIQQTPGRPRFLIFQFLAMIKKLGP